MEKPRKNSLTFWLFISPALFALLMVIIIPFFLGLAYSFTNWTPTAILNKRLDFIGLANYLESFKDPRFLHSFLITSIYTVFSMLLVNIIALGLALLVSKKLVLRNFYRAGFFLPNLIGGLVLGFVWQFIFNNALPSLFSALGATYLADPSQLMLANRNSAMVALIIVSTWQHAGYIMIIYLAAIEAIPQELIESSLIDGASSWNILRRVKLPLIAQAFTICIFLTLVGSFKQFDVNVSLTAGGPSVLFRGTAIHGTELLTLNIFNVGFGRDQMAVGQARAVLFFAVLVIMALVQVFINKRREIEL